MYNSRGISPRRYGYGDYGNVYNSRNYSPVRTSGYNNYPLNYRGSQYIPQNNVYTSQYRDMRPIPGEVRQEFYPVERKHVDYEMVPVEKTYVDQEVVEYQTEYIPRVEYDTYVDHVPVKNIEYVPVQRTEYVPQERIDYVPQERVVERIEYDAREVPVNKGIQENWQASYAQQIGDPQPLPQQYVAPPVQQIAQPVYQSRTVVQPVVEQQIVQPVVEQQVIQQPAQIVQPTVVQQPAQVVQSVVQPTTFQQPAFVQQVPVQSTIQQVPVQSQVQYVQQQPLTTATFANVKPAGTVINTNVVPPKN